MNLNGPDIGPYRNKTQNYEKKSNRRVTIRFYLYERFVANESQHSFQQQSMENNLFDCIARAKDIDTLAEGRHLASADA